MARVSTLQGGFGPGSAMIQARRLSGVFPTAVVLVLCASPLLWAPLLHGASRYDNQRLLELLCVGIAGLLLLWHALLARLPQVPVSRSLVACAAGVAVLGALSAFRAYSSRHGWLGWGNAVLLVGLAWLVADSVRRGGDVLVDRLLRLCGIGCAIYLAIVAFIWAASMNVGRATPVEQFIAGFDNYRFFNHVQTVTLPLLGLLAARQDEGRQRGWWVVTSCWWALVYLTAARGAALGLGAGLVCVAALGGRTGRLWALRMGLSALAGLLGYLLVFVAIPVARGMEPMGLFFGVVDRSLASPASGRLILWRQAWEMLVAQPWLGAGPLHFAHFARSLDSGADPHNWFLEIACEWGLPALTLVLLILGAAFRCLRRLPAEEGAARDGCTRAAWIALLVAAAVDGTVSSLFVVPTAQLWLAWSAGCAWGWCASRRQPAPADTGTPVGGVVSRVVIGGMAVLALWGVVAGAWPEASDLAGHRAEARVLERPGAVYWPRFWQQGYF